MSDADKSVGAAYDAQRVEGEPYFEHGLPRRLSYLIAPGGMIAKAYELGPDDDLSAHAAQMLSDIAG